MRYILPVLALAASAAHAQFKCTASDGSVSFQGAPCAAAERAERLVLPPAEVAGERPERIRRAIAERKIVDGMTRAEVNRVMRVEPSASSRRVLPDRVSLQLVYRQEGRTLYIYLDDGVVTSSSATEY